jgi:hypothetical protein
MDPKRVEGYMSVINLLISNLLCVLTDKSKVVPLHAMEALGGRGGIAPTHSRPRH